MAKKVEEEWAQEGTNQRRHVREDAHPKRQVFGFWSGPLSERSCH